MSWPRTDAVSPGDRLLAVSEVGDPAYERDGRLEDALRDSCRAFRSALAVDDRDVGARARGLALSQSLMSARVLHAGDERGVLVLEARRWLAEVLADHD